LGIWSKVAVLLLSGLVAAFGTFPLWARVGSVLVAVGGVAYLIYRERVGFRREFVKGNLLYLLPGHVALLLGLGMVGGASALWWAWLALIAATVAFDWNAHGPLGFEAQRRVAMALYALIWADVLFLIERLVRLGGELEGGGALALTAGIALFGVAYIGLALYRFGKLQPANE